MKCSDLLVNQEVVFNLYSDIFKKKIPEIGTVLSVSSENKTVCISYLEGYKSRSDDIPFDDMLAVYDENGEYMEFDNIKGKSILLTNE